tara:strand:+ start:2626 stop:2748 length:123 start_codon:yes stop_codon:yes gene_type:complete
MWQRFKKAGFFVSVGAVLFFILKIVLKNSYVASVIYRWFD